MDQAEGGGLGRFHVNGCAVIYLWSWFEALRCGTGKWHTAGGQNLAGICVPGVVKCSWRDNVWRGRGSHVGGSGVLDSVSGTPLAQIKKRVLLLFGGGFPGAGVAASPRRMISKKLVFKLPAPQNEGVEARHRTWMVRSESRVPGPSWSLNTRALPTAGGGTRLPSTRRVSAWKWRLFASVYACMVTCRCVLLRVFLYAFLFVCTCACVIFCVRV